MKTCEKWDEALERIYEPRRNYAERRDWRDRELERLDAELQELKEKREEELEKARKDERDRAAGWLDALRTQHDIAYSTLERIFAQREDKLETQNRWLEEEMQAVRKEAREREMAWLEALKSHGIKVRNVPAGGMEEDSS